MHAIVFLYRHVIATDMVEPQLPDTPTAGVAAQPMSSLDGGTCAAGPEEWLLYTHPEALHQAVTGDMTSTNCNRCSMKNQGGSPVLPETPVARARRYRLPVCSFAWSLPESTKAARCLKWNPSFSRPFKASLQHHPASELRAVFKVCTSAVRRAFGPFRRGN